MIEEKKPASRFAGSSRFIVRGSSFLPLDRAAILRPKYDEYPERYPLVEGFPQPGRRSGSRPPARAGGAGGEGEVIAPETPGSIYPEPRSRTGADAVTGLGGGAIGGAGAGAGLGCLEIGDTLRNSPQVPAAGGIRSFASRRIPRPFIITHIQYWSSNTIPSTVTDADLKIFISDDGSQVLTALVSSGTPLDLWEGGSSFEPHSVATDHYPLRLVPDAGMFIKMQWINNGAAAIETMLSISWKYLN